MVVRAVVIARRGLRSGCDPSPGPPAWAGGDQLSGSLTILSARRPGRSGAGCPGVRRRGARLEPLDDRVGELARASLAAEVVGRSASVGDDRTERCLDLLGGRLLAEM